MGIPLLGGIFNAVDKVLGGFISDKGERERMAHDISMTIHNQNLAQVAVNLEEAKHPSIFVSGWRPAVGWLGVVGLSMQYVIQPIVAWIVVLTGSDIPLPELDTEGLMTLLMSILGVAGLRTFEKVKKVARK